MTAWARRLAAHPGIAGALAAGRISPSFAREICEWSDRLPGEHRADADRILLDAAAAGAELADLAGLAEEIHRRCAPPDTDDDDDGFARRWLRLTPHYRGHARLDGDLTPQAAAAVRAVLESLGKKRGPEDDRTEPQRHHDALEEACTRLVAGGLPDRAGQPTQIQLAMSLEQLMGLPAAASATGWDHNHPPAPPGAECDASIVPMVTGHIDGEVLAELAASLVRHAGASGAARPDMAGGAELDMAGGAGLDVAARAARAARQLTISRAVRLLSGPAGLASFLRTSRLSGPAASVSLPLDVGAVTETVPPWLRRAIIARAGHCEFPGCDRPPDACHVHHLIPRSEGGTTSLTNCWLGCAFHHLVVIHRWGWQVTLNADDTTTATSPDGRTTLHSHTTPAAA